ncbi:MAG: 50S ribosomal protein L11 [Candidatus Aenigmarchaeota archaeon]|nr:50S ribosomal protein L11 [Candidatus Aenigmarchaeota archaeon]
MPTEKISVMVEGGKATAAPPLGPALGPLGVPIKKIIDEINNKTKGLAGMQVPVTVIIDKATKNFEIKVGTPPVSALIKKELGLEKGCSESGKVRAGDLTDEQVRKIALAKFGSDAPRYYNMIIGSARSMGVTVGKGPLSEAEAKELKNAMKRAAEAKLGAAAPAAAAPGAEGAPAAAAPVAAEPKKEEKKKEEKKRKVMRGK